MKDHSMIYRELLIDRLVNGVWCVWDGTGNVYEFATEAGAKRCVDRILEKNPYLGEYNRSGREFRKQNQAQ